ncbi:hypothetical protein D7S89_22500 [Trinickia fusca]|uniref:Uncharacterized protein n=2 Tax=Trinickia fusca TaxID=2419777 RepID=A0A494X9P7_9BURK|nr:hypothetical protein D7S89_22500 [Trinickia fusca]
MHGRAIWLGVIAALMFSSACRSQQVWLSGVDPVVAADRAASTQVPARTVAGNDFMDLFHPDAAWQRSAASIQIFKVSTQFLHRASDSQLRAVIEDLRRRHIALAMEAEILTTSVKCGNGVPGYTTAAVIQKAVRRVSQMGGEIAYVAFDEPMTWGHFAHRAGACQYTAEEVVDNITPNIEVFVAAFPAVKFGDIEPVSDQTPGRFAEILRFAELFGEKTGRRLSFLQADLIWQNNWKPQLAVWKTRLHEAGIAYGVVVDGDPGDHTDIQWTDHAVERYRELAGDPTVRPDEFVVQSWQPRPTMFLPENKPGTLTSVIVRTVAQSPR